MKTTVRYIASLLLILAFVLNALPCGPGYISPVFEYDHAPENPYENFAAGRLGILKPTLNRSVLFAAYRYLNGGGFNAAEQKALVEVWQAEFDNKDFRKDDIGEAVKAWVEKRKETVGEEGNPPEIYAERAYGGYDFFPNCTKNAFEVATETLSSRAVSYGSDSKDVKIWVAAQDRVFQNCTTGQDIPEEPDASMAEWLQKDRAYQIAAAKFYSLDYEDAKNRFLQIALDSDSPWQETADYLVGRTLIRQASLVKDVPRANEYYSQAEQELIRVANKSNKYSDSAVGLLGLVKYRLHPRERVRELARNLTYGSNEDFRQNMIDYRWLLNKFENEELEKAEKAKETFKTKGTDNFRFDPTANANSNTASGTGDTGNASPTSNANIASQPHNEGDLRIALYFEDTAQTLEFYVKPDANDDEAIAEAEKAVGRQLSDNMKKRVREARQSAYASRFADNRSSGYPERYYGSETTSLSILPGFIRSDDLTDWLFTYQIEDDEAYLYSLSKFRQTSSDIWLMTAISKAKANSAELKSLIEAAGRVNRSSPGYPTIAYNTARIYLEQGKTAEARKLLDEVLDSEGLTVSARNRFLQLRLKLAATLEDFIKFSLRKPFAFDFDGQTGTVQEIIAEQKTWYDPANETKTREEYDREVDERWANELLWQDRQMFDDATIDAINNHFPLAVLMQMESSPALPDYLRDKFALPIFTRALLLGDAVTLKKIAPQIIKDHPELETQVNGVLNAKTPGAIQNASLFLVLKNPMLSPYVEGGLGKGDNEMNTWDGNDWWCTPYEGETGDVPSEFVPGLNFKPAFLTSAQSATARLERNKLKGLGDAPQYLGDKVMAWAKRSPLDRRVPESLYIVWEANGWTKYGCGNNEELQTQIGDLLKRRYPGSEWAKKMDEQQQ